MQAGVYQIMNTTNGKRYIGGTDNLNRREKAHRSMLRRGIHHNIHLQRAWSKYGEHTFKFKPLLICAAKQLILYEQLCLCVLRPEYNSTLTVVSPTLGRRRSAETRAKIAKAKLGKKLTPEHCASIALAKKGKKMIPFSIEARANIAAAQKGRKLSREHRAAIAKTKRGVPWSSARRNAFNAVSFL